MNEKFDRLAKGLSESIKYAVSCVGVFALLMWSSQANDFKRGPLIGLSDPDPFGGCVGGLAFAEDAEQVESFVASNPVNPKNIVAAWIGGKVKSIVAGVTFDGGGRWRQVVIPGLTHCTGGTLDAAVDPWLAFAPKGDVYAVSVQFTIPTPGAIIVSKSRNGGLNWSNPVALAETLDPRFISDKPSVTADPSDSRYVYVTWALSANGNRGPAMFTRTNDGAQSWEPSRVLFDPETSDQVNDPTIAVLPDGTVLAFFLQLNFANANGGAQKDATLSLIRSSDRGQTWSNAIRVAAVPGFNVTDPDTGQGVASLGSPVLQCRGESSHRSALCRLGRHPIQRWTIHKCRAHGFKRRRFHLVNADSSEQNPGQYHRGQRQAFLPVVAVAADGTTGVSYYDFRFNTPAPRVPTDRWLVHCHPKAAGPPTDPRSWKCG